METVAVNCNSCGAPLDVGAGTNYVTCAHCGARLTVKRTATSAYTEILENIDRKTDAITGHLAEITRQNEVERIDREWTLERGTYLTTDKQGDQHEPNAVVGVIAALVAGGFGLFWTVSAAGMGAPGVFPLFGLVFVGGAIYTAFAAMTGASKYADAKARYEHRRAAVLAGKPDPDASRPRT